MSLKDRLIRLAQWDCKREHRIDLHPVYTGGPGIYGPAWGNGLLIKRPQSKGYIITMAGFILHMLLWSGAGHTYTHVHTHIYTHTFIVRNNRF